MRGEQVYALHLIKLTYGLREHVYRLILMHVRSALFRDNLHINIEGKLWSCYEEDRTNKITSLMNKKKKENANYVIKKRAREGETRLVATNDRHTLDMSNQMNEPKLR